MTDLNNDGDISGQKNEVNPADSIEKLIKLLDKQKRTPVSDLDKGETCLYFSCWQVPYKVDGSLVHEHCIEVFIGNVKNTNPLGFYEAVAFNSYHGNLRYIKENFRWSLGQNRGTNNAVKLKIEQYEELKKMLGVESWRKDVLYDQQNCDSLVET